MLGYKNISVKAKILGSLSIALLSLLSFSMPSFAANYYLMEGNAREGYVRIDLELVPGLVADVLGDDWLMSAKNLQEIEAINTKYTNLVIYDLRNKGELETELFLAEAAPGLAPVFKDIGGHFQIVTGKVRVVFAQDLGEEQVKNFFEDFGITKYREVSWQENGYEVSVAPGVPALELADRLRIMPQVWETYPDMWMNRYSIQ